MNTPFVKNISILSISMNLSPIQTNVNNTIYHKSTIFFFGLSLSLSPLWSWMKNSKISTSQCKHTINILTLLLTHLLNETEWEIKKKFWMKFSVHQKINTAEDPKISKKEKRNNKNFYVFRIFSKLLCIFTARLSVFTSSKTIARFLSVNSFKLHA